MLAELGGGAEETEVGFVDWHVHIHAHALQASPGMGTEKGVGRTVGQVMGQGPQFVLLCQMPKIRSILIY